MGEKRKVTLLNVDIRGYSEMSRRIKAEDIVKVLNFFFMTMGTEVSNQNGIVDKYLGDGFLALFGAPMASGNTALDAVHAALKMVTQMKSVNEFCQLWYPKPLKIGVSINTGEAIVGNIGYESKMDYTVIGDVVNDTFRLQELTKESPDSIVVSHSTYQAIQPFVEVRPLGMKSLGRDADTVSVYQVIGQRNPHT